MPRWPPDSLRDVGEDETLPGLPQDGGRVLCEFCEFVGGSGDVLSTSDDCLSPEPVDVVESTGGDSGLPRMLEILKDVYCGLQAGLSAGLLTESKLNEWW